MPRNLDKIAFFLSAALLTLGLAFGAGLYSGVKRNFVYDVGKKLKGTLVLVRANIVPGGRPIHFLQPARSAGSGVTVNEKPDDGSLIFISGFFDGSNELRLVRRDGTPVAKWPVRFSDHFPDPSHLVTPPKTDHNIDTHGALIHPDGSVAFNYEYSGTVKLSRCGKTIWTLAHPTHHSLEVSERGGYLVPVRNYIWPDDFGMFPPMTRASMAGYFIEDLVLRVSDDGKIESRKSIPEILYSNGLESLMTSTGYSFSNDGFVDAEITHVNKIEELPSGFADKFPEFEAGDLVISLRNYNLLFVVDPDTWKVKWYQIGPWRRQHDPEFNGDGTITVFNNNTYRLDLGPNDKANRDAPRISNIVKVNPSTGQAEVVYGQQEGEEFFSVIRGKHETVEGGGFLITEFEAGRVFETDSDRKIVWEYINRYDEDEVLEVTEARIYPSSYFTVEDWSCP